MLSALERNTATALTKRLGAATNKESHSLQQPKLAEIIYSPPGSLFQFDFSQRRDSRRDSDEDFGISHSLDTSQMHLKSQVSFFS